MKKYRKALVAASGVLIALGEALSDGAVDGQDSLQIVAAIALAVGVWGVRNAPPEEA